jgi:hypothetical protein
MGTNTGHHPRRHYCPVRTTTCVSSPPPPPVGRLLKPPPPPPAAPSRPPPPETARAVPGAGFCGPASGAPGEARTGVPSARSPGNGTASRRRAGICPVVPLRPVPAPDGGFIGMFVDGRFGRFTTGGFGTVTVILGGGGTRSAAPTAPAIDTKVKQKPPTLDHLDMFSATLHSYPRLPPASPTCQAAQPRLQRSRSPPVKGI